MVGFCLMLIRLVLVWLSFRVFFIYFWIYFGVFGIMGWWNGCSEIFEEWCFYFVDIFVILIVFFIVLFIYFFF